MKLTRQEEIALLFASELARQQDVFVPLSDIAGTHGVSVLFLKKIALCLKKHQLVISREGLNGGYKLGRKPEDISAWDIFTAVSGKSSGTENVSGNFKCPLHSACLPQTIRLLISEAFRRYVSDVTIDQFIKSEKHI